MGELDETDWMPVAADAVMVTLRENEEGVQKLISVLSEMYSQDKANAQAAQLDTCFGPAVRLAHDVLKRWGGRIVSFCSSLSRKGKGFELTNREQELGKLIGTDAESTLFRGVPKVGSLFAFEVCFFFPPFCFSPGFLLLLLLLTCNHCRWSISIANWLWK